jgi:peptidoglycan/xylan/chitin deacetylase (PgdA/CDA1 family)
LSKQESMGRRTFLAGAAAAAAAAACSSPSSSHTAASGSSSAGGAGQSTSQSRSSNSSTSSAGGNATFVSHGQRTKQQVALTFHVSGDRALAVTMLDLLHAHRVVVTAFMVGTFVDQNPDLMSRFTSDGHELANHTYSHLTFASLPHAQMVDEVTRCRDALQHVAGTNGGAFRPSGTANGTDAPSQAVLDVATAAGYSIVVGYDVDPADYADPGADAVVARTSDAVRAGSIVSLHFGHQGTVDALPRILTAINDRGLTPVTVQTLLSA